MKSLWEPVCQDLVPGDSRSPFPGACSLSQGISAQEIQHLCHLLDSPVAKVASEGLLLLSICIWIQLSPSVALKNPIMNHLKHWMCIFIIKTMKQIRSGCTISSHSHLAGLCSVIVTEQKIKIKNRRSPQVQIIFVPHRPSLRGQVHL